MIEHVEVQILLLLLIASVVGMGARRLRLPYTLALVAAGLVLGFVHIEALAGIELNRDLLLLLFLPALLFEAALHIDPRELRRELVPILGLAIPGVLVATAVTAVLLYATLGATALAPGFGWPHALLVASVISATDPVSVLALFKELGVPRRLYLLVEGESLLNDGVAVVVFVIVASVLGVGVGHGATTEPVHGAWAIASFGLRTFLWMAGAGTVVGLLVGGAVAALTRQIDDHLIETTLTTLVAYGSFLLAEQIGASGVLSTVAAGIVTGSLGRVYGMSVSTRVAVEDFWSYMAFLANSFIFLLVGLELEPPVLLGEAGAVVVAFVCIAAGRAVVIYGGIPLTNRYTAPVKTAWRHVMWWGGLRGSLSMVLVLTLPPTFPGRGMLINLVFGVVALSLFGQGLTIGPLLRQVGLAGARASRNEYERARVRVLAHGEALEALAAMHKRRHIDGPAYGRLRAHYEQLYAQADAQALEVAHGVQEDEQILDGLRELVQVEREAIRRAVHDGLVPADAAAEYARELDLRREAISRADHQPEVKRHGSVAGLLDVEPAATKEGE